jgi:hypothetical protein
MPRRNGVLSVALAFGALAVGFPVSATADDAHPPQGVPAISQYVEAVPSSSGPSIGAAHPRKLKKSVQKKIDQSGGSDAAALSAVARSAQTNAPTTTTTATEAKAAAPRKVHKTPARVQRDRPAVSATRVTASGSNGGLGGTWTLILIAAAALSLVTMLAVYASRRRAHSRL